MAEKWICIDVGLRRSDAERISREAAAMGLSRSRWVAALIHRRVTGAPQFSRDGELALQQVHTELRRLRAELAIFRRRAPMAAPAFSVLEGLDAAIERHMRGVRAAFRGNLSYWEIAP